jgi:hypothetical protein
MASVFKNKSVQQLFSFFGATFLFCCRFQFVLLVQQILEVFADRPPFFYFFLFGCGIQI